MNFSLDKLWKVRALREHLAQRDLTQGRRRLDQADQKLSRKQRDLQHHRLIKSKQETRLFNEIDGQAMSLGEFEVYRGRIRDLCVEEQHFLKRVRQAEIQKDAACARVDRLSMAFQKRCRESAKLKEVCTAWNTKVEEEKTGREQDEVEEMALNRFLRNDLLKV